MPRSPMLLPAGVTLANKVAFGNFARIFPMEAVRSALEKSNKSTIRTRELPNEVVVYLSMMLGLYRNVSNGEVLRCTTESLEYLYGDQQFKITGRSGVSQARSRVGWKPLESLFSMCVRPLAEEGVRGCFYRRFLLTAFDGTYFTIEDTIANREYFGSSKNQHGEGTYPKAHVEILMELGTRAVFGVNVGKYLDSETFLATPLIDLLKPNMLVLADRLYAQSFEFFKACSEKAKLLWRVKLDRTFVPLKTDKDGHPIRFEDGSFLAVFYASTDRKRENGIKVRVIEYISPNGEELIRLFTTILEPELAPAPELATLYHQRWEIETGLKEIKTHLGVDVIRSKSPNTAIQEVYGIFMSHYVLRTIIYEAAKSAYLDPDELSFTHTVHVVGRAVMSSGSFPPEAFFGKSHQGGSDCARLLQS